MKVSVGRQRRILTKNSGVAALEEIVGLGTSNSNVENVAGTPKLVDDSKGRPKICNVFHFSSEYDIKHDFHPSEI